MEIEFYERENGNVPAMDFLKSLNVKLEAKTARAIALLHEFGTDLREPVSKPLMDGIFELRASFGGDDTRVLYFFFHNGKAVLTHGFVKKTNKTPLREIEKAKNYRKDYLSRTHG